MKKILSVIFIAVFAIVSALFVFAEAAGAGLAWFGIKGSEFGKKSSDYSSNPSLATRTDVIKWLYTGGSEYSLFIPSGINMSAVTVYFSASTKVYIGDVELKDGKTTDVFAHAFDDGETRRNYSLTCDGNTYTLRVSAQSAIGSCFITTESGSLSNIHSSQEIKEAGYITIIDGVGAKEYDGKLSSIKGRGNATWGADKKPYNIKLDKKAPLFGMATSKKWSLMANAYDSSHIRNKLAATISKEMGVDFVPDYAWVDMYINNEYMGLYAIAQKVEIEEGRVDIFNLTDFMETAAKEGTGSDDLSQFSQGGQRNYERGTSKFWRIPRAYQPEDITGGFLLEMELSDRYGAEASGFVTSQRGQAVVIKYPEFASYEQVSYISSFYQDMENAVYSETGYNSKGKHYSEYIDVESFAKAYVWHEYVLSLDVAITSFYLYKDSDTLGDGKIHCGVPWDFDNAFGGAGGWRDGVDLQNPTAWWANQGYIYGQYNDGNGPKHLIAAIWQHDEFKKRAKYEYFTCLKPAVEKLWTSSLTEWSDLIRTSARSNTKRWGGGDLDSAVSSKLSLTNSQSFMSIRNNYITNAWKATAGDANNDGVLDFNDVKIILLLSAKRSVKDLFGIEAFADYDRNSTVNAVDALKLLGYLVRSYEWQS